ncbi:hypothetical protein L210DRAFT_3520920 [Boletus edulis BED1]|uniref:Uncharacterized protein n=1 Tax=Boletus edulis BED1 TaxID=1328754 RepID=A0AAD4C6V1_BOLED|nr:hypothetical protein L210DRAFT_3520920 [Boletus edulis BED1]
MPYNTTVHVDYRMSVCSSECVSAHVCIHWLLFKGKVVAVTLILTENAIQLFAICRSRVSLLFWTWTFCPCVELFRQA